MKQTRIILSLLAICLILVSACNEEGGGKEDEKQCGNFRLDGAELCEKLENGDYIFAEGARVCPQGFEVADVLQISCSASCTPDTGACVPVASCGDGEISGSEMCDGEVLGGKTCGDFLGAGASGVLKCSADCLSYDVRSCKASENCGNNALDEGELCDQLVDGSFVFAIGAGVCPEGKKLAVGGAIACGSMCEIDESDCVDDSVCGDGKVDGEELCDGVNLNNETCASQIGVGATGDLACLSDCKGFDSRACERCVDNAKRCEGGELKTCENGAWILGADAQCPASYECVDGASACMKIGGVCESDVCEAGLLRRCVAGALQKGENCDNGYECLGGAGACSKKANYCDHGKCENMQQFDCKDNEYLSPISCAQGYECQEGFYVCRKKSNYCTEDECSGITKGIYYCVNNELASDPVPCEEPGYECRVGFYEEKKCVPSLDYCTKNRCNVENDQWRECTGNLYSGWKLCPNDVSCKDAFDCGECNNAEKFCTGDVYNTCASGTRVTKDCSLEGKLCDDAQGCVLKSNCGNGVVDADEICDASDASHNLSGNGALCESYSSTKYTANGKNLKCAANCTLDDSECTKKPYNLMGICHFQAVDINTLKVKFTPETSTNAAQYQFRLSCAKKLETNANWMTDLRENFEIIDVPANNNAVYERIYDLEAHFSKKSSGFESVSSKGPGLHYCALQYRIGTELGAGLWSSYDTIENCSAVAKVPDRYSSSITEADTRMLTVPKRVELVRWDFETSSSPSSGILTTGASISREPVGDMALTPSAGVGGTQALVASNWSMLQTALEALNAPFWKLAFSTAGKRGISVEFSYRGNYNTLSDPAVDNHMLLAVKRGTNWEIVKDFTNYNASYPEKPSYTAFDGVVSEKAQNELRLIPYDMKVNNAQIMLDNVVVRAWE